MRSLALCTSYGVLQHGNVGIFRNPSEDETLKSAGLAVNVLVSMDQTLPHLIVGCGGWVMV